MEDLTKDLVVDLQGIFLLLLPLCLLAGVARVSEDLGVGLPSKESEEALAALLVLQEQLEE